MGQKIRRIKGVKAFIYAGGNIYPDNIEEIPKDDDLVIAADSGYNNALKMNVKPDILIGDFDSLKNLPDDVDEIYEAPCEKDLTDTQLAVEKAIERGCDEIVIVGGLDGRLDHTLSLLSILEGLYNRNIRAIITSGQNRIRYIKNSGHILLRVRAYKYFGLIACDETVKGVSIEGAKYKLKNAKLTRTLQYAVSNEIEGNCALITVKKGGLYIIESRDM